MFLKPCVSKWLPVNLHGTKTFKFSFFGNVMTFVLSKITKTIKSSKYLHIIMVFCCHFLKIMTISVLRDKEVFPKNPLKIKEIITNILTCVHVLGCTCVV